MSHDTLVLLLIVVISFTGVILLKFFEWLLNSEDDGLH
jgi:hypothetical protein